MLRRRSVPVVEVEVEVVEPPPTPPSILDQYVHGLPSDQAAIDLFAGEWASSFPESTGLRAGTVPLFEDPRLAWAIEQVGGVDGKRVLELGPLEAGHTTMLHRAGADVVSIESNSRAYLKCLVVKEVMGLVRSRFLLGDFGPYLETTDERFDLVVASGVLYHSPDPPALLEALARVGDRVVIWTHYFDDAAIAADAGLTRMFDPEVEWVDWRGHRLALHRRNYLEALDAPGFCGGPESSALWMEREGLMTVLRELGYRHFAVTDDDPDHPNGPCVMLVAEKVGGPPA